MEQMSQATSGLIAQVMPFFVVVIAVSGGYFHNTLEGLVSSFRGGHPEGPLAKGFVGVYMALIMAAELVAIIGGGRSGGLRGYWSVFVWLFFGVVLFASWAQLVRVLWNRTSGPAATAEPARE